MSNLDENRWASLTLAEQMANIGSEVGRSAKWVVRSKPVMAESAFLRALELIDLTIKYGRLGVPQGRACLLRELCRARDCYSDAYMTGDAETLAAMDRYFGHFANIVRR